MMVPLTDVQGQVVGFTGRIIGAGEPKYINTPATLLYNKGRQVFGLYQAKQAIRAANFAVLVEGNLDVISSHQAGIKNVVAAAGTALTADHLRAVARLSRNVRLCFDGDKAGVAATERAITLAENLDLKLSVITLPDDAKDPDELILQSGAAWRVAVDNHQPAVQWVINQYAAASDLSSAQGKKTLTTAAMTVIVKLRDAVEREHYMKILAELTGASLDALNQKLRAVAGGQNSDEKRPRRTVKIDKTSAVTRRDEQFMLMRIMAIAGATPTLRSVLKNLPDVYLTEPLARVKYYFLGEKSITMNQDLADKLAELELVAEHELTGSGEPRLLMLGYLRDLELSQLENRRQGLTAEFAAAAADDTARRELVNGAIKGVNRQIKTLRETGAGDDWAGLFAVWDERKTVEE
jgi:DNA primase